MEGKATEKQIVAELLKIHGFKSAWEYVANFAPQDENGEWDRASSIADAKAKKKLAAKTATSQQEAMALRVETIVKSTKEIPFSNIMLYELGLERDNVDLEVDGDRRMVVIREIERRVIVKDGEVGV